MNRAALVAGHSPSALMAAQSAASFRNKKKKENNKNNAKGCCFALLHCSACVCVFMSGCEGNADWQCHCTRKWLHKPENQVHFLKQATYLR